MHEHNNFEAQNESFTAMVYEQAALFGATPGPDEFDNRPVWDEAESTAAVTQAFRILAQAAPDGTQLADERANLLWGFGQHPRRPDTASRPRRRQAHPRELLSNVVYGRPEFSGLPAGFFFVHAIDEPRVGDHVRQMTQAA